MDTIVATLILCAVVFVVAVAGLSIKVIFRNRTPLKRHACEVMCRHGHDRVCVCEHEHDEDCAGNG